MNTSAVSKKSIIIVVLALALLAAVVSLLFVLPFVSAKTQMPDDAVLVLKEGEDGLITLSWPEVKGADRYFVEVLRPYTAQELDELKNQNKNEAEVPKYELCYGARVEGTACVLPEGIDTNESLTIWINTEKDYKWPFMPERVRMGEKAVQRYTELEAPAAAQLTISPNAEDKTARISWMAEKGDMCILYVLEDGRWRSLGYLEQTENESIALISFGEDKDLPIPDYGQTMEFAMEVYRRENGLEFYGRRSDSVKLVRDDLLGTVLELDYSEDGHNVYTFTWNETKGDYYELQQLGDTGIWNTVHSVEADGDRSYTSSHLKPFEDYTFRVVAHGKENLPGSEFCAVPAEVDFRTWESAVFSTIWPLMELDVYSDTQKSEVIGKVPAAKAFCVIDEEAGFFKIRYEDTEGYIDSNFCLINLPEYMGDLCGYNITNSYSAIYMVHEFEIPKVTDTIVAGYEDIQLHDESFMVPLLYPVAQRLISAAEIAQAEGYRLKIYDAYRPNMATRSIYDLTLSVVDTPLPSAPFDEEITLDDLNLPADVSTLTYRSMLVKGNWTLGNFLATSGSYHNMGIALDLTLEERDTGEELEMQSSMHDLSWYSVINENNSNAYLLDRIMKEVGFGGLTSEWWHFQDNEVRDDLGLKTFMWSGVTPRCWMLDDTGWRYRELDGTYLANTTRDIDGARYRFGPDGYVIE